MKKIILLLSLLITFIFADIDIVTNKNCHLNSISRDSLKKVFYGVEDTLNNSVVIPLEREETSLKKDFYIKFFHMNEEQVKTYWIRMIFTGRRMLLPSMSKEELDSLKNDQGVCYITYKDNEEVLNHWKILNETNR